jgi:hypothetical protein
MKELKKLILQKHKIIRNNQNAKEFILRRLLENINKDIKKLQYIEIDRLKLVYERNTINNVYNQQKIKKLRKIKVPLEQRRLQ